MWELDPTPEYDKKQRKWPKKHRRELTAMLNNLDTFLGALRAGATPRQAKYGFIHPERRGVLAIDQKGGGPGLKQSRLYVYPDEETEIVHLITLGDKDSQSEDIKACTDFVQQLREERETDRNG